MILYFNLIVWMQFEDGTFAWRQLSRSTRRSEIEDTRKDIKKRWPGSCTGIWKEWRQL